MLEALLLLGHVACEVISYGHIYDFDKSLYLHLHVTDMKLGQQQYHFKRDPLGSTVKECGVGGDIILRSCNFENSQYLQLWMGYWYRSWKGGPLIWIAGPLLLVISFFLYRRFSTLYHQFEQIQTFFDLQLTFFLLKITFDSSRNSLKYCENGKFKRNLLNK